MDYSLLIDRYLEGKLSQEELERFEKELNDNAAFAEAVNKIKSLQNSISKHAPEMSLVDNRDIEQDKGIKDEIDCDIDKYSSDSFLEDDQRRHDRILIRQILEENRPPAKSKYILINRAWIIAACIVALISISSIVIICRSQFNASEIYDEYYSPPSLDFRTRSSSSTDSFVVDPASTSAPDLIYVACIHYSQGNYWKAIELLSYIPEDSLFKERCHLISGLSYMELGKYNQAIVELQQVTEDILGVDTAKWYLGLSYLKNYDLDKAFEQFTYLASRDHIYGQSSHKISKKLSKFIEGKKSSH